MFRAGNHQTDRNEASEALNNTVDRVYLLQVSVITRPALRPHSLTSVVVSELRLSPQKLQTHEALSQNYHIIFVKGFKKSYKH